MTALTIAPNKLFEFQKDGVVPVLSLFIARAVSVNNVVVTAVAGKRIRVVGLIHQGNAAVVGSLQFLDGNAGTILYSFAGPTNVQPPYIIPPNILGLFETSTGVGLFDSAITNAQAYTIQYITYTP